MNGPPATGSSFHRSPFPRRCFHIPPSPTEPLPEAHLLTRIVKERLRISKLSCKRRETTERRSCVPSSLTTPMKETGVCKVGADVRVDTQKTQGKARWACPTPGFSLVCRMEGPTSPPCSHFVVAVGESLTISATPDTGRDLRHASLHLCTGLPQGYKGNVRLVNHDSIRGGKVKD